MHRKIALALAIVWIPGCEGPPHGAPVVSQIDLHLAGPADDAQLALIRGARHLHMDDACEQAIFVPKVTIDRADLGSREEVDVPSHDEIKQGALGKGRALAVPGEAIAKPFAIEADARPLPALTTAPGGDDIADLQAAALSQATALAAKGRSVLIVTDDQAVGLPKGTTRVGPGGAMRAIATTLCAAHQAGRGATVDLVLLPKRGTLVKTEELPLHNPPPDDPAAHQEPPPVDPPAHEPARSPAASSLGRQRPPAAQEDTTSPTLPRGAADSPRSRGPRDRRAVDGTVIEAGTARAIVIDRATANADVSQASRRVPHEQAAYPSPPQWALTIQPHAAR